MAQQLQGRGRAWAHGQLLLQTGPEALPGRGGSGPGLPEELLPAQPLTQGSPLGPETWVLGLGVEPGGLTSIFSLAPSSRFLLIWATLCRAFRVRSSLPEEAYQRADSMKNLGGGGRCWHRSSSRRLGWVGGGTGGELPRGLRWGLLKSGNPGALSSPSVQDHKAAPSSARTHCAAGSQFLGAGEREPHRQAGAGVGMGVGWRGVRGAGES